ncbi:methyltransferase domain-containing protein [Candidatus Aminicenantes bacterium AC-334-K16]|jgi:ubiquinone/menaquinone biosynthesis C-methylase UbiE|nr:methyltransferase domain-containing protein [Candidatus Aminicenantes bacterium AC-334-K16]
MNEKKVSRFYDVVWTEYIPEYQKSEEHWRLFYSPDEVKGKRILDAGCGTGIFSIIFARHGADEVIGLDISAGSLTTARKLKENFNLNNVDFHQADMLHLPFPEESFDVVWAWGTVHHTIDPWRAMEELIRVLKPGGSILLAVYTKTKITFIHEIIRKLLIRTPRITWQPLSKIMAFFLWPVVAIFKKREKSRQGEKLEELILDWYFVPIRHHYYPQEIKSFLEKKGFTIEKFLPASGRFDSTSNFIYKARK